MGIQTLTFVIIGDSLSCQYENVLEGKGNQNTNHGNPQ